MQMVDFVHISRRKRPDSRLVPFVEFEALLSQLRQHLNTTNNSETMEYLGYAGGTNLSGWRKDGKAPLLAVNAIKGVLAELKVAPAARVQRTFDLDELAVIFTCVMRSDAPERAKLLAKIAKELTNGL